MIGNTDALYFLIKIGRRKPMLDSPFGVNGYMNVGNSIDSNI